MSETTGVTPEELGVLFREQLNLLVEDIDEELIDTGMIDSMSLVDLMFHLEQQYSVSVDVLNMDIEDFRTLRRIAAYVERRVAEID